MLAAFFVLIAALPKLIGSHASVQEFGLIGAGQWLRYLVGTVELAGAIGLLTPTLAGLAAAGLAADMAGATITNATVLRNTTYGVNVWMTALLCAMFVLLAYNRRQQIKAWWQPSAGNGRPAGPESSAQVDLRSSREHGIDRSPARRANGPCRIARRLMTATIETNRQQGIARARARRDGRAQSVRVRRRSARAGG